MKNLSKALFLSCGALMLAACGMAPLSSSIEDLSSLPDTASSIQSSFPLSSSDINDPHWGPTYSSRPRGVSPDDLKEEAKNLSYASEATKVRITFTILETVTGSVPKTNRQGQLPDGYRNESVIVIERTAGGGVVSDGPSFRTISFTNKETACDANVFESGTAVTLSGWLGYQGQRRGFLDQAQEGEGFVESLTRNPYKTWMYIYGVRPANSSVEGSYFGSEEYERTYDENGLCQTMFCEDVIKIKGTLKVWNREPQYYDGVYKMTVNGVVEYLTE